MLLRKNTYLRRNLFFLSVIFIGFNLNAQTPVEVNGSLAVIGNQIINKNGKVVSFAGNSLFWSNKGWMGAKFYNKDVVEWLKKDWNTSIIRCPLASDPNIPQGYHKDPVSNLNRLDWVIKAAIKEGMYVIIDWHSHEAEKHIDKSIDFFKKMAIKYGKHPNIIYEIYNEPLRVSWDSVIKPYAEKVIEEIRKIDQDNLIIVGTPKWSQDVDIASENPIIGYENIAYSLHFYAGSHKEWLRNKVQKALDNEIAIMVTEWGAVKADGDGDVDEKSVAEWMAFMKKNNLTHCNWAINDKKEGASILKPGASTKGNWKDEDLTVSGKLVKGYIVDWDK